MTNYFTDPAIASRYAKGRPRFHSIVAAHLRDAYRLARPVEIAVDVGCGVGLSSIPLTAIADRVVGIDSSPAMIANAETHERVEYIAAQAENMPLGDESADMIAAGSAYHWFDQPRFLAEAKRILRLDGFLAIYHDWFNGEMLGCPEFNTWFTNDFSRRYPRPATGNWTLGDAQSADSGFVFMAKSDFKHDEAYDIESFVEFLTTMSNIGAAIRQSAKSIEVVSNEIASDIAPFFRHSTEEFGFSGSVLCYRKLPPT